VGIPLCAGGVPVPPDPDGAAGGAGAGTGAGRPPPAGRAVLPRTDPGRRHRPLRRAGPGRAPFDRGAFSPGQPGATAPRQASAGRRAAIQLNPSGTIASATPRMVAFTLGEIIITAHAARRR